MMIPMGMQQMPPKPYQIIFKALDDKGVNLIDKIINVYIQNDPKNDCM